MGAFLWGFVIGGALGIVFTGLATAEKEHEDKDNN